MRCCLHASLYTQNCFITLTYDESLPGYHNNFDYRDVQLFKKSYRQRVWREKKRRIQIFNVHEYGKNGKKHWHLVVFNHDFDDKVLHTISNGNRLYKSELLADLWPHGFSSIGDVTEASAMYQAQYTQKDFKNGNSNNSKKSHSKHSGIGRDYFLRHYSQILRLGFVPFAGRKAPIPRYFLKLADKHRSHFYEPDRFFDLPYRKAVHRPFKGSDKPNKEIADLYNQFLEQRQERIAEISAEWDLYVSQNLFSSAIPAFRQAGENALYDLKNKPKKENF